MATRRFDEYYRCYPVAMLPGPEREDVNHGGKVFMAPSALDKLTRLHITYPMLFELINENKDTLTHAGVLEFIAEEGKIYLPYWVQKSHIQDRQVVIAKETQTSRCSKPSPSNPATSSKSNLPIFPPANSSNSKPKARPSSTYPTQKPSSKTPSGTSPA